MRELIIVVMILLSISLVANDDRPPIPHNFLAKKNVRNFIDNMVRVYHFDRQYLRAVLKDAKLDRDTLDRYTGRYKVGTTNGSWQRYKAHVLDRASLNKAKRFKRKYYQTLKRASREYGVPIDYIVGFIAVESKFNEYTGDYRLLDSLTTLAFYPNRMQKFFRSELKHFFLMCREERFDPYRLEGSFAGAMGSVQQVPSVYRKFGMDYDRDGRKDPWSLRDSIGIIARFMHNNGWNSRGLVAIRARYRGHRFRGLRVGHKRVYSLKTLRKHGVTPISRFNESKASLLRLRGKRGDELWLGAKNFRILTKYNNSTSYGMAIHKIAEYVKY
jgi:membrane-bound lytic murein transglycosylase B